MEFPGLGTLEQDREFEDWLVSDAVPVPVLGGLACRFTLDGYATDDDKASFHRAVSNFLSIDSSVLRAAESEVFRYYLDMRDEFGADTVVAIATPADVWKHVQFDRKPLVSRRKHGDRGVYVSLTCECAWEEEHGLELVFKDGRRITTLGQYSGALSNADAFADDSLEGVVYVSMAELRKR